MCKCYENGDVLIHQSFCEYGCDVYATKTGLRLGFFHGNSEDDIALDRCVLCGEPI